jgi:hypothetical protein
MSGQAAATPNIHLKRQIEFIRDTDPGPVHDVIIKVRSGEKEKSSLLATVAEALRRRALSSSARDILPAAFAISKSRPTPAAAGQSLVAWTRRAGVQSSTDTLRILGQEAIDNFVRSDVVTASRIPTKGDDPAASEPVRFWSSQATVLRVRAPDLENIAREAAAVVEEILPNQRLSVPPFGGAEASSAGHRRQQGEFMGVTPDWGALHLGSIRRTREGDQDRRAGYWR